MIRKIDKDLLQIENVSGYVICYSTDENDSIWKKWLSKWMKRMNRLTYIPITSFFTSEGFISVRTDPFKFDRGINFIQIIIDTDHDKIRLPTISIQKRSQIPNIKIDDTVILTGHLYVDRNEFDIYL